MAEPSRLLGQGSSTNDAEDSDLDGEHEEDIEMDQVALGTSQDGNTTDAEGSDVDAEGEEIDEEEAGDPVGAVKISAQDEATDEEDEDVDEAIIDSSSDAKPSDSSESDSGSSESDAEHGWEAESDAAEEVETELVDPNRCM